jgi:hypothetical protein
MTIVYHLLTNHISCFLISIILHSTALEMDHGPFLNVFIEAVLSLTTLENLAIDIHEESVYSLIEGLTSLKSLYYRHNGDIQIGIDFSNLHQLEHLHFQHYSLISISHLDVLAGSLKSLDMESNPHLLGLDVISELTILTSLRVATARKIYNAGLPESLEHLYLYLASFSDYSNLANLKTFSSIQSNGSYYPDFEGVSSGVETVTIEYPHSEELLIIPNFTNCHSLTYLLVELINDQPFYGNDICNKFPRQLKYLTLIYPGSTTFTAIPSCMTEFTQLNKLTMNARPEQVIDDGSLEFLFELPLTHLSMSGRFQIMPPFIGHLSSLEYLDFSGSFYENQPFPTEILDPLTNLVDLKLSVDSGYSSFSGPMDPHFFTNHTNLQRITIWGTYLNGSFPHENLQNMKEIGLLRNLFTDFPSPVPAAINLEIINLNQGDFVSIPSDDAFLAMTRLKAVSLSNNQLPSIPKFWAIHPTVEDMELDYNSLVGTLPQKITSRSLKDLNIDSNSISGPLPQFSSFDRVFRLSLSDNQLSGVLPISLARWTFTSLRIDGNQFSGCFANHHFSELSPYITSSISLNDNQFSGLLPNFGAFTALENADLGGNHFDICSKNGNFTSYASCSLEDQHPYSVCDCLSMYSDCGFEPNCAPGGVLLEPAVSSPNAFPNLGVCVAPSTCTLPRPTIDYGRFACNDGIWDSVMNAYTETFDIWTDRNTSTAPQRRINFAGDLTIGGHIVMGYNDATITFVDSMLVFRPGSTGVEVHLTSSNVEALIAASGPQTKTLISLNPVLVGTYALADVSISVSAPEVNCKRVVVSNSGSTTSSLRAQFSIEDITGCTVPVPVATPTGTGSMASFSLITVAIVCLIPFFF